jgi:hypothetical protein
VLGFKQVGQVADNSPSPSAKIDSVGLCLHSVSWHMAI